MNLDQDGITFIEIIADAIPRTAIRGTVQMAGFGQSQKSIPTGAEVDEGGIQPLVHGSDATEINIPDQACRPHPFYQHFYKASFKHQRHPGFPRRGAEQNMIDDHESYSPV